MTSQVPTWLSRPGLLRTLLSHVRLSVRLVREPRVPLLIKAVPLLATLYVISPLDFIPDVLPVLGQLDDLGIILIGLEMFLRLCPSPAVAFHHAAVAANRHYSPMLSTDDVIDANYRVS